MRRAVEIGPATLLLGDCRELLGEVGAIDAVVSDPPYGINFRYGPKKRKSGVWTGETRNLRAGQRCVGDDAPFNPAPLLALGVPTLLWGANNYCQSLPEGGRWLAWNKLNGLPPWDSFSDVEFAWHSQSGASRIFSYLWKGGLARRKLMGDSEPRCVLHQKPIAPMSWCLEQIGPAEVILDPYMGSGTTGLACLRDGRRFIGIEIDPDNFAQAVRRIKEAVEGRS